MVMARSSSYGVNGFQKRGVILPDEILESNYTYIQIYVYLRVDLEFERHLTLNE